MTRMTLVLVFLITPLCWKAAMAAPEPSASPAGYFEATVAAPPAQAAEEAVEDKLDAMKDRLQKAKQQMDLRTEKADELDYERRDHEADRAAQQREISRRDRQYRKTVAELNEAIETISQAHGGVERALANPPIKKSLLAKYAARRKLELQRKADQRTARANIAKLTSRIDQLVVEKHTGCTDLGISPLLPINVATGVAPSDDAPSKMTPQEERDLEADFRRAYPDKAKSKNKSKEAAPRPGSAPAKKEDDDEDDDE